MCGEVPLEGVLSVCGFEPGDHLVGRVGDGKGGACRLDRHTAYTQPLVLPCSVGTDCKHTCSVVPLVHCQAACYGLYIL